MQAFDTELALRAWQRFVQMGELIPAVPAPIARSWFRCKNKGLLPVQLLPHKLPLTQHNMSAARAELAEAFRETFAALKKYLGWEELLLVLVDPQGVLLEWQGNQEFLTTGSLTEGMILSEETLGTSALTLAGQERESFFVQGAQHYFSCYHPIAGFATPLLVNDHCIGILGGWATIDDARLAVLAVSLGGRVLEGTLAK